VECLLFGKNKDGHGIIGMGTRGDGVEMATTIKGTGWGMGTAYVGVGQFHWDGVGNGYGLVSSCPCQSLKASKARQRFNNAAVDLAKHAVWRPIRGC